jgi:hypothetical protein
VNVRKPVLVAVPVLLAMCSLQYKSGVDELPSISECR